jgi:hypothetical protein
MRQQQQAQAREQGGLPEKGQCLRTIHTNTQRAQGHSSEQRGQGGALQLTPVSSRSHEATSSSRLRLQLEARPGLGLGHPGPRRKCSN